MHRELSSYRAGDAWFICDRCSQRRRRSHMLAEWTGLRVCAPCIDPRPPQMSPPDIYPEGIPFYDARPPQDNPDHMQDDTSLVPVPGGFVLTTGQYTYYNGGQAPVGSVSPQDIGPNPAPTPSVNNVSDATAIRSGPVSAPSAS